MPTVSPENNKFIYSRIVFELADAIKAAVALGLREEWLPTLEDDFKASLLADFALTAPGVTEVAPDAKLADKLAPYIDWYKKNWEHLHPLEDYKWAGVKHFQEHFDINAEDIAANIKEAFRKASNLLSGYEMILDQIRDVLVADDELMALLAASQPEDNYAGHLLTQDFIYCVAIHLLYQNKPTV